MTRAQKWPLEQWSRVVRTAVRARVQETGEVPGVAAWCSAGPDAASVLGVTVTGLEDQLQVKAALMRSVREAGSHFAGFGGFMGERFGMVLTDGARELKWSAPADEDGLGGWSRGGFKVGLPVDFLRRAVSEARKGLV